MGPATDDPTGHIAAAGDQRLGDLEAAEAKRAESHRLDRKFELFEAIVLSIAALLAAWTGFQSAKWSGVQANSYSQAGASRVESTRASTTAGQETTVDVITFTQWLQAAEAEGLLAEPARSERDLQAGPERALGIPVRAVPSGVQGRSERLDRAAPANERGRADNAVRHARVPGQPRRRRRPGWSGRPKLKRRKLAPPTNGRTTTC